MKKEIVLFILFFTAGFIVATVARNFELSGTEQVMLVIIAILTFAALMTKV